MAVPMALSPGTRIGQYEIRAQLGAWARCLAHTTLQYKGKKATAIYQVARDRESKGIQKWHKPVCNCIARSAMTTP